MLKSFCLAFLISQASLAETKGLDELSRLSDAQLEAVFAAGTADHLPHGVGEGRSIVTATHQVLNDVSDIAWRGKTFDSVKGTVVNDIFGYSAFRAFVSISSLGAYLDQNISQIPYLFAFQPTLNVPNPLFLKSRAVPEDGKPSIIVDYSNSEVIVARNLIDEMRQVLTDQYKELYLGRLLVLDIHGRPWLTNYFALQFPTK